MSKENAPAEAGGWDIVTFLRRVRRELLARNTGLGLGIGFSLSVLYFFMAEFSYQKLCLLTVLATVATWGFTFFYCYSDFELFRRLRRLERHHKNKLITKNIFQKLRNAIVDEHLRNREVAIHQESISSRVSAIVEQEMKRLFKDGKASHFKELKDVTSTWLDSNLEKIAAPKLAPLLETAREEIQTRIRDEAFVREEKRLIQDLLAAIRQQIEEAESGDEHPRRPHSAPIVESPRST